ncbi:MAG: preprotein translocase subunit SecG [Candidatus Sungbacteria bacterium]|nr:preprotein translocase subunit SecG [Candidatus Sungbacteria bacterium]
MKTTLIIIQIVVSVLLAGTILLQQRGTGLSATFGGEGNIYRTKRGIEKTIFISTIILAVLFFAAALVNVFVY